VDDGSGGGDEGDDYHQISGTTKLSLKKYFSIMIHQNVYAIWTSCANTVSECYALYKHVRHDLRKM